MFVGANCCLDNVRTLVVGWLFRVPSNEQGALHAKNFYAVVLTNAVSLRCRFNCDTLS